MTPLKTKISFLFAILLFSGIILRAQEPDPYAIIDSVSNRLGKINDYQADIEIEVDVDFIRMPVKHARIFYKKPDIIKFESDEFIMLPKRGFDKQVTDILNEPYSAIYLGREELNGRQHDMIRIVPLGKRPDVILATWWIDPEKFLIARNESTMKKEGNFTVEFIYGDPGISLPTEMIFTIEIEKFSLPLKFIGKSEGLDIDREKMKGSNTGKVYIRFDHYSINTSMTEDIFH